MSKFEVGVHAVIFDDQERILLGHRRDMDLWDLPGGGLEPGELPTEGVIRETEEETGLDVEVERLFLLGVTPDSLMGFVFYCHVVGGEISTTDETDVVAFFARNELPEMITPRKQEIIEAAYRHPVEIWYGHITQIPGKQWYAEQLEKKSG